MNYLTDLPADMERQLEDTDAAYISRYALGRDYHKVLRSRLQRLAELIEAEIGPFGYRVFTDSAPVMERALARKAGLGWFGKHTNIINREDGSWFFLGEIYTDLELPPDPEFDANYCGSCTACIDVCPTAAIPEPYTVDARRCISYLTIEYRGSIPREMRNAIGNRVFGCDDCQAVCPWNRYPKLSAESDFNARHGLGRARLLELFTWDATEFEQKTRGSALRRVSFEQWQRNLAVALGNSDKSETTIQALGSRLAQTSELVAEHIRWALAQLNGD